MSDAPVLIEIGCEEIPARMIPGAARELETRLTRILDQAGFKRGSSRSWGGSRRIAVFVEAVQQRQPDREEELLGPPAAAAFDADGAPTAAARGFAGKHGLDPKELQSIDTPKGARVGLRRTVQGRTLGQLLEQAFPPAVQGMGFPKTMRWGAGQSRWVRPVHWLLALHGDRVLPIELFGHQASKYSVGHRFLGAPNVEVPEATDYQDALLAQKVIVDPAARREMLAQALAAAAAGLGGVPVDDAGLLNEVRDLVEWPGVVAGEFDPSFLDLPRELLVTTLRHHQKCFSVQREDGTLLPGFLAVTNAAGDAEGHIRRGNEWVVVGRLEDARFFWAEDRRAPLAASADKLDGVVFHRKSGSFAKKAQRMAKIAGSLAAKLDLEPKATEQAQTAARLCKIDLVTSLVGEFPELQGVIGGLMLEAEGESQTVSRAVYEHYRPTGPADTVPGSDVAGVTAVADKLDSLAELLRAGERPTGSRDPFGMRRAANGTLRIAIERGWSLSLQDLAGLVGGGEELRELLQERIVSFLRDSGYTPNEVQAVLRPQAVDERFETWLLPDIAARLAAIRTVRDRDDFRHLVKLTERVDNILTKNAARLTEIAAEAGTAEFREDIDAAVELGTQVERLEQGVLEHSRAQRYDEIVGALAELIGPVDRFFADVLVLDPEQPAATRDRGRLLDRLRNILTGYFDIRELAGQADRRTE